MGSGLEGKPHCTLLSFLTLQNNPPTIVRERILGLVQYWADAFKGKPQLTAVEELYEQLKGEGVEFPPVDLDALAPVETPQRVCVCAEIDSSFMSRPDKALGHLGIRSM